MPTPQATLLTFAGITPPLTNRPVIFTPPSFGTNLKAWFAADQNLTVASGRATAWAGLGPASGFNLVPLNGGLIYVPNAQNGLPGVKGGSSSGLNADGAYIESLQSYAQPVYQPLNFNYNNPFTASLAFIASPTAGNNFIIGQGNNPGWNVGYRSGQLAFYFFGQGGYANNWMCVHSGFTFVSGTAYTLGVSYSGATGTPADVSFNVNGIVPTGVTSEVNGTLTGGTQSTGGPTFSVNPPQQFGVTDQTTVLEFFVASQAAAAPQLVALDKYLNGRWAIHA